MQDGTGAAAPEKTVETTDQTQGGTESQQQQEPEFVPVSKTKPVATNGAQAQNTSSTSGGQAAATTEEGKKTEGEEGKKTDTPATTPFKPSDEQLVEFLNEKTGMKLDNFKTIKEKLSYQAPKPEPTAEEKTKAEQEKEQKLLTIHLANGRTLDEFAALKSLANGDVNQISINKARAELKEAGFDDAEIDDKIKEIYYQVDDAEIEKAEENDKKTLKKLKDFGNKTLASRGTSIQAQAKGYFESLTNQMNEQEAEKIKMAQHSSNVEEAIKNFERKTKIELGKIDEEEIPAIDTEIPAEVLSEVKEILKDPVKFENQFYNKEGELNLSFIIPHLVRSISYKNAVKQVYLEAQDRTVKHFESIFGSIAPSLGGPKKVLDDSTTIVRKGKKEYVPPTR